LGNAQQSRKRSREDTGDHAPNDEDAPKKVARTEKEQNVKSGAKGAADAALLPSMMKKLKSAGSFLEVKSEDLLRAIGFGESKRKASKPKAKQPKILRELETGTRGVLDELDLDASFPAPGTERPSKRAKKGPAVKEEPVILPMAAPRGPLQKTSDGKRVKKWQEHGLYVGQDENIDPAHLHKKPASASSAEETNAAKKRTFMPLPMFSYLENSRDFTIPFDIYAPSLKKGDEKPKDWHKINRNRLVGEAKDLWEKPDPLPLSVCVCPEPAPGEQGCGDDCLNRVMQYECNEHNCCLSEARCSNRAFIELSQRIKKGGAYDIGVEVVKTNNRGFGIRAVRAFLPGQIIMEYTGEIISEGECQRRMREDYKDKQCYYLMELERNLVIDGTKGSMARFINHSCDPNCEVRMVKVNGTPRMAVYAGDAGIMTGEELTYDYNFDNFGEVRQNCYCGASTCRGFLSKRLNATEQKKQAKAEEERRQEAALAAQKAAEREANKKQVKKSRGSGWRGWVAIDDAEVKEQLKAEKRAREEAAQTSSRAMRLASRRGEASPAKPSRKTMTKEDPNRRKTIGSLREHALKETKTAPTTESAPASKKRRRETDIAPATSSVIISPAKTKPSTKPTPSSSSSKIILNAPAKTTSSTTKTVPPSSGSKSSKSTITTVTLSIEEIEISHQHHQTPAAKGKLPQRSSSTMKLKQSLLSFKKID
jgi:histone-lysine N-methyltransferase ASH1L